MSTFSHCVKKLFNRYRLLVRKSLSAQQKTRILNALGLRANNIREANDMALYSLAERLSSFLRQELGKTVVGAAHVADLNAISHHDSIPVELLEHILSELDKVLAKYIKYGNCIAHVNHIASSALINIIQLICFSGALSPEKKAAFLSRLDENIEHVLTFGTLQQKAKLYEVMTQACQEDAQQFAVYLKKLVQ